MLNLQKCFFSKSQVNSWAKLLMRMEVRPNLDKVQAIQDVRPPHNVDEIGRFLGMCNHPSRFSLNLTQKTKPLRELLHKRNPWMWGEPHQRVFTEVKEALMTLSLIDQSWM